MDLIYRTPSAIKDIKVIEYLNHLPIDLVAIEDDKSITDLFCKNYLQWILSTDNKKIVGLENFSYHVYSHGTTESFDKFYMKHHMKRFRCFKGEYLYHQLAWRNSWPNWRYIEDEELAAEDAVVISIPFSDTGDIHMSHEDLLNQCDKLGIPVLVDCAYFNLSQDIEFNFDHPCITDVTFSLSKLFPVGHLRIGLRLTKVNDDDPLFVLNKISYVNRIGAYIGNALINEFAEDYIVTNYRNKQLELCRSLNLLPSKTVIFGIGGDEWQAYNRGTATNRLSISAHLC
jgi:hypothetical protein